MTTNVPVGSVIRYYYRREWEYSRIVQLDEGSLAIQIIGSDADVPVGTRIFQGVWVAPKRSHFEVRCTYVTK